LLCIKIIDAKSEEVKAGCRLAESSKEACGSKKGYFSDYYFFSGL
jgi:hypothetical protein